MPQPVSANAESFIGRLRAGARKRATGIILTLFVELLLCLALLTLAPPLSRQQDSGTAVKLFNLPAAQEAAPEPAASPESRRAAEQQEQAPETAAEEAPPQPAAAPERPVLSPFIPLTRDQLVVADIGAMEARPPATAPARPLAGPPNTARPGDTPRVPGAGPNGEPLYAAAWYREPYDDELSGYLATASGPGWGLIACRTAPNFRVEDCVALDEYPERSNIARAVLAAAWQFKVRPPQIGGRPQVGEWVRIRIDYGIRRTQRSYEGR
ncbi:hypothetical protein ACMT1E_02925 [Sphingomonas flavalba]|uniref:hypothetical protein n=1 Tax=Sphingomonas flavalba TaxID=2559804 RepID=UPI0039E11CDD